MGNKGITKHTAPIIVSWPYPKQWLLWQLIEYDGTTTTDNICSCVIRRRWKELLRPQYHASTDTRGNNGPLWRHNSYRWRLALGCKYTNDNPSSLPIRLPESWSVQYQTCAQFIRGMSCAKKAPIATRRNNRSLWRHNCWRSALVSM